MTDAVVQINTGLVNVFLIRGGAGCVLVDAGNPGQAHLILKRMAKHGVAPNDVRLILITHGHVDHFGSAAALRKQTGAPVAIHALDAGAARQGAHQQDSLRPTNRWIGLAMRLPFLRLPDRAPAFEPDVVLEGEWRLDEYGVAGRVIHTPGHTPGSISALLDGGEAIVGDMVMGQLMGLIHKPGPPIVAWDLARNRESVRRLLALSPRVVYVGHGGPFRAEEVSEWNAQP
ncbi:MAG: MBL fold metallo-hydrolase [Chloroflexota bacterium]|nr:MBL fold metallo-hydrolase [Chloroflexota bacterium]